MLQNVLSKRMRNMDATLGEHQNANTESTYDNVGNIDNATTSQDSEQKPTDPNEPVKPVSAFGLFFRDTVSAIKQENPSCTFPEICRIVKTMWESLEQNHKNVYMKRFETTRTEYLKEVDDYRQRKNTTQKRPQQQTQETITNQQLNNNTTQMNSTATTATVNQNKDDSAQSEQQSTSENSNSSEPPQQMQLLTEAGAAQKCTREDCNKRAIINPDWEDEYCSNECVVIHCRNVFNEWVKKNIKDREQRA